MSIKKLIFLAILGSFFSAQVSFSGDCTPYTVTVTNNLKNNMGNANLNFADSVEKMEGAPVAQGDSYNAKEICGYAGDNSPDMLINLTFKYNSDKFVCNFGQLNNGKGLAGDDTALVFTTEKTDGGKTVLRIGGDSNYSSPYNIHCNKN